MSIEQTHSFHLVRRILRAVAPEFRLLTNDEIEPGDSVLDLQKKTIEIGEDSDEKRAIAALLFQLGHVLISGDPKLSLFFGRGVKNWKKDEDSLVKKMTRQAIKADARASDWAESAFLQFFPVDNAEAQKIVGQYRWSAAEWQEYFKN